MNVHRINSVESQRREGEKRLPEEKYESPLCEENREEHP